MLIRNKLEVGKITNKVKKYGGNCGRRLIKMNDDFSLGCRKGADCPTIEPEWVPESYETIPL